MIEVMGQADSFRELQTDTPGSIVRIFEGLSGEDIIGYVVELAPTGYAGPINMMVGILSTESKITGMRILRHNETPGLGSLATRERFYRRFDGRSLNPLRVVKYSPGVDEIEAITSSTITTKAITNAVNEAIEWYKEGGFR
jgi:electron transport complex protein RnfG